VVAVVEIKQVQVTVGAVVMNVELSGPDTWTVRAIGADFATFPVVGYDKVIAACETFAVAVLEAQEAEAVVVAKKEALVQIAVTAVDQALIDAPIV
jgi:hypothetical protein